MKKYFISILICTIMIFSLVACGKEESLTTVHEELEDNTILFLHTEQEYNKYSKTYLFMMTSIDNSGHKYTFTSDLKEDTDISKNLNNPNFLILMMEEMIKNDPEALTKWDDIPIEKLKKYSETQKQIKNYNDYNYCYNKNTQDSYKGCIYGFDYQDKDSYIVVKYYSCDSIISTIKDENGQNVLENLFNLFR